MNKIYHAYVCHGDRESGYYSCYGQTYIEAAKNFGDHWNKCTFSTYGKVWQEHEKKSVGYPYNHLFLIDEKGNRVLLFDTGETTTFRGY